MVSIFIQFYVNSNLHLSTLDTNNPRKLWSLGLILLEILIQPNLILLPETIYQLHLYNYTYALFLLLICLKWNTNVLTFLGQFFLSFLSRITRTLDYFKVNYCFIRLWHSCGTIDLVVFSSIFANFYGLCILDCPFGFL